MVARLLELIDDCFFDFQGSFAGKSFSVLTTEISGVGFDVDIARGSGYLFKQSTLYTVLK
jgi:hypothetical protein